MRSNSMNRLIISSLMILFLGNSSNAAGLAGEGKSIAQKWCASCHIVSDSQSSASADVPSFKFIASKYQSELEVLGAFLADPHPVMPNLSLTRREIKDLLAYIESLN
ncbi:MAG: c-type cytochrome [Rhizobiaceae bacterium]